LLGLCDRLGRGDMTLDKKREEEKSIKVFIERCNKYLDRDYPRSVQEEGLEIDKGVEV